MQAKLGSMWPESIYQDRHGALRRNDVEPWGNSWRASRRRLRWVRRCVSSVANRSLSAVRRVKGASSGSSGSPRTAWRRDNVVVLSDVEIAVPLGPGRRSYAKARADVRQHLDGSWSVYFKGQRIAKHDATTLSEPQRVRVKTRRSRPAKGADEAVLVYFPALDLDGQSASANG